MTIKITKQLATVEDLAIGTGTVVQERNGVPLTLTKIDLITASKLASSVTGEGASLVLMESGLTVEAIVNAKANQSTTYTETQVNSLLNAKANQSTTYTKTEANSLLNAKAAISGQTFTGNISATNLSGANTGDQTNISGNAATVSTITTTQVGDATAGLAAGAIGSYAFLKNNTGGTSSFGSNVSGGSLVPATANGSSAGSVTGTWQCRGFGTNGDQTNWLRIS